LLIFSKRIRNWYQNNSRRYAVEKKTKKQHDKSGDDDDNDESNDSNTSDDDTEKDSDDDEDENSEAEDADDQQGSTRKAGFKPFLRWTGRRLARHKFPNLYEAGKVRERGKGTESLQLHRPAEKHMWESLSSDQRKEMNELAENLNNGAKIDEELQRK
jgi:hypothetical protein